MFWTAVAILGLAWIVVRYDLVRVAQVLVRFSRFGVPTEIHLDPVPQARWRQRARAEKLLGALRGLGFEAGESYRVREVPGMRAQVFSHHAERVYAALYEMPLVGLVLEFDTHYADGTSVTYTTSRQGMGQEDPPGHRKVRLPGLEVAELFHRLLRDRPLGEIPPLDPERLPELFEREYADELLWRNSRGGPTTAEIQAMAEAQGKRYPVEVATQSRKIQFEQAMRALNTTLRRRLPARGDTAGPIMLPEAQLVYVHDDLSPELLAELVGRLTGVELGQDTLGAGPARQVFAGLNSRLPEERRFRKVGELREPLPGDVYALPRGPLAG